MSKKKKNRERITRESYEARRYEPVPNYKAEEQVARLDNDLVRLNEDYENNKDEIIKVQGELINRLKRVLSRLDEMYRQQLDSLMEELQRTRAEVNILEPRIRSVEERTTVLAQEVNNNTTRLNNLIAQINEEKARTQRLTTSACNAAISEFNEMASDPIYSKFCYNDMKGVEFGISKFNEQDLSVYAKYAIAVSVLCSLAKIKSVSEAEWNKFIPAYESLKTEVDAFIQDVEKSREVTLEAWPGKEINLDFWTENGYTALCGNLQQFDSRVKAGKNARGYHIADVKMDSKTLQVFDKQLQTMVENAKARADHSLCREEAGKDAMKYLENLGFEKSICQFEGDDERRPYVLEAIRYCDEWKVTLVFASDNQERRANCLILHNHFIDPNVNAEFVTYITAMLQKDCHIQCMMPNEQSFMGVSYVEEALKPNGYLNESIQLLVNNHNYSN